VKRTSRLFYERRGKKKEKRKEEAQIPDVVLGPDRLVGIGRTNAMHVLKVRP
jgi:hypothetical protein